MSTRYGIGLALEPTFTARVYRARQIICGQYASWAAEMNMVYVAVADFFRCTDSEVTGLEAGLSSIALRSNQNSPQFPMAHRGVGISVGGAAHIFLDFNEGGSPSALNRLHDDVVNLLEITSGVTQNTTTSREGYQPQLPLMQFARLRPAVFEDAAEFSRAVVADLQVPDHTRASRLLLLRFQSDAAGGDWSGGAWAADLRWELLASHPL